MYDSSLTSFAKIKIVVTPKELNVKEGETITLNCRFEIPEHYSSFIRLHDIINDTTRVGLFKGQEWLRIFFTGLSLKQMNEKRETFLKMDPAPAERQILFTLCY
ncbi:MAG: hypothetical protein WDO71_08020 [Bacteroidota bacterium]